MAHAFDMERKIDVAIKIIKSQAPFARQAQTEIQLLEFMRDRNIDQHGVVRLLEHFMCVLLLFLVGWCILSRWGDGVASVR